MTTATTTSLSPCGPASYEASSRWELLRALGWLSASHPTATRQLTGLLNLTPWSPAEHTRIFVLDLPPYASAYVGEEGKLGGEASDRAAGFWRALGLEAPSNADHLACLLSLYAGLGQAADNCSERARRRLEHARSALLSEHLLPWVPMYLVAAASYPGGAAWARLALSALHQEAGLSSPLAGLLPAVLRDAPPPLTASAWYDELLGALTTPVRAGFIVTHADLERCGQDAGVGVRRGERRFVLAAMLGQDPSGVLRWLAQHGRRQATSHRLHQPAGPAARWWEARAKATAAVLEQFAYKASLRSGRGAGAEMC